MNKEVFDPAIRASMSAFTPKAEKRKACSYKASVESLSGNLVSAFAWSVEPNKWSVDRVPAGAKAQESQDEIAAEMATERAEFMPSALEKHFADEILDLAASKPRELLAPEGQTLGTSRSWFYKSKCSACSGHNMTVCRHCSGGKNRCDACHSRGQVNCSSCGGLGTHQRTINNNGQISFRYDTCYGCHGTGNQTCHRCNGAGRCDCRHCAGAGLNICPNCKGGYQVMELAYELAYRPVIKVDSDLASMPSASCVTTFGSPKVISSEPLRLSIPVFAHQARVFFEMYGVYFEHRFWGQTFAPEDEQQLHQQAFGALLGWLSNPDEKDKVKAAKSTPIVKSLIAQTRSGIKVSDVREAALGSITQAQALQFELYIQAIRKSQGFFESALNTLVGFLTSPNAFAGSEPGRAGGAARAAPKENVQAAREAPARPAGLINQLWQGRASTAKLFWLYGIVGSHVGMVLVQLVGQLDKQLSLLAALFLFVYLIVVTVGIWRSASSANSNSPFALRIMGRMGSVFLGLMLLVTIGAFLK